jgi:hypothetical protein
VGGSGETCLLSGGASAQVVDPEEVVAGDAFYYVVRARNACGVAGYGTTSGGVPRTTAACP